MTPRRTSTSIAHMTAPDQRESGSSLLTAMAVLWVLTLLGTAALATGMRTVQGNLTDRKRVLSIHAADAGVELAKSELFKGLVSPEGAVYSGDWGNGQTYEVTVSPALNIGAVSTERRITSTGTNSDRSRTLEVTMFKALDPFSLFMRADDNVDISGGGLLDWYDSRVGTYGGIPAGPEHYGNVRSNRNILIGGGSRVYGDAIPGPGHTTSVCNNCTVTGDRSPANETLDYPLPDVSDVEQENDNDKICPAGSGDCSTGVWSPSTKTISVPSSGKLTLRTGTYNLCRLHVSSGGSPIIALNPADGPIRIYFSGPGTAPCGAQTLPVEIRGGSWALPGQIAANLQLYVRGSVTQATTVELRAGGEFAGAVYAPASHVNIQANADLYGAFVSKSLTIRGGGSIHYDRALAGSGTGGTPWTQTMWLEQ